MRRDRDLFRSRVDDRLATYLGDINIDIARAGRDYPLGAESSGADIRRSFVGEMAHARGTLDARANLAAWLRRFQARPASRAALKKGGGDYNCIFR